MSIVWTTKQFRPYIYGTKFIIQTDHRLLIWLFHVKDPGIRLLRWRLKLEELVADELSRYVRITEKEKEETWQDLLSLIEEKELKSATKTGKAENQGMSYRNK